MNPEKYSSENKESVDWEPIDFSEERHGLTLKISEMEGDNVRAILESEDGEVLDFEDLLPEGYDIHGNKAVYETDKHFGMGNVDTSMHIPPGNINDSEKGAVLISQDELESQGWKYILTLLHEIGHVVDTMENPEEWERFQEACGDYYTDKTKDNLLKRVKETSKRERKAWAFAVKEFKNILSNFDIDRSEVFEDKDEFMNFINDISFVPKMIDIEGQLLELGEDIPEEKREEIIDEIFSLFVH